MAKTPRNGVGGDPTNSRIVRATRKLARNGLLGSGDQDSGGLSANGKLGHWFRIVLIIARLPSRVLGRFHRHDGPRREHLPWPVPPPVQPSRAGIPPPAPSSYLVNSPSEAPAP